MFENLLGQPEALAALRADVEADRLPPALLLSGPPGSGKLTAALELARALSCARGSGPGGAPWNCPCPSCARHRVLAHPDLLLFGPRTFPEEVTAALELLGRAPGKASAYFFVRAARKLARRFDAALYEGEETRLAKAAPLLRELEEALEAVAPERATAGSPSASPPAPGALAPGAEQAAAKAALACAKLEAFVPAAPPVFQVRAAETWARLAPLGHRKVAVVENADLMQESSRNALLKILEEPPESVRFVLLTSRRTAVMGTILSRARVYSFRRRDAAGAAEVIERVFRSGEPASGVDAFLAARRPFPPAEARERAEDFLSSALGSRADAERLPKPLAELALAARAEGRTPAAALAALLEATRDLGQKDERFSASFRSFLEALAGKLRELLGDERLGARGVETVARIAALSRAARADCESWNRSPALVAETLLRGIAEAR